MHLADPIARPSLHEELVDRLRRMVVEDVLKPGEKVPEKSLCEAFGVSRTPLREALKVLASEGFVVLQANRGARVAEVTSEELAESFTVLAALERLAGELACAHLGPEDLARLEALHAAILAAYAASDLPRYFQANQDIHALLIRGAGNTVLEDQHRRLAARVRRARFMINLSQTRWAEAVKEHDAMMVCLRGKDAIGLGQAMQEHMLNNHAAFDAAARDADPD